MWENRMATGIGGTVIHGPEGLSQFGRLVRVIGDVNGDGVADFAVSAPSAGNGYSEAGSDSLDKVGVVYVFYGREGGFDASIDLDFTTGAAPDGVLFSVIQGELADDWLGETLDPAGDINGDGVDDLIVGSRYQGADDAGAAYVIYGKAGGLDAEILLDGLTAAQGAKLAGASGKQTGAAATGIGDVNGDGDDDLLVISPGDFSAYIVFGDGADLPASSVVPADLSS
jgi:hypothetical protein